MKHKYKLGDYVEYYSAVCGTEYTDLKQGFVNAVEDRMQEDDNDIVVRYMIGQYIGAAGYVVRESAIIKKLKAPKYKSRLEYLKTKIVTNEMRIKVLDAENKQLRKEIEMLEKESLKQ